MVNTSMDPRALTMVITWTETLAFGIYTALFFESTLISIKRSESRAGSALVFLVSTFIMYIIATLHIALGLYRTIVGYVYTPRELQEAYWFSVAPEQLTYYDLSMAMSWMGEFLLIYRCWIIWGKETLIMIPSVIMFFAGLAIGLFIEIMWRIPGGIAKYPVIVDLIMPVFLAQNVWTSFLISYRLIRQHHQSQASGIADSNLRINLYHVGLIMLESAAPFTIDLIIAIILHSMNSNLKLVFIELSVPIIGISFSLIAVRLHLSSTHRSENPTFMVGIDWAVADPMDLSLSEVETRSQIYDRDLDIDQELGGMKGSKSHPMGMLLGSH